MRKRALDSEHQAFLSKRLSAWIVEQPDAAKLRDVLMLHGGLEVVAPPNNWEGDMRSLLDRGTLLTLRRSLHSMKDNGCHQNAAELFRQDDSFTCGIGTGWALSNDLWRQHSWCVRGEAIIETTVEADAYFGIILYGKEAEEFCHRVN